MNMKTIIVDCRISEKCERALIDEGFSLIKLTPDGYLSDAVASHPDTVLFYSDGEIITTLDYYNQARGLFIELKRLIPPIKINITDDKRAPSYPDECILNALVIGERIFCKSDTVSKAILKLAEHRGYKICHTRQGYPACSVLSFGECAITADEGLASLMRKNGVNVTLISQGHVSLPPYKHGFIGGASGVCGDKIYFFGDISSHPDCDVICNVIRDAGFTPVSLSDEPLADLGGIIAL